MELAFHTCIYLYFGSILAVCPVVGQYTCFPDDVATKGSGTADLLHFNKSSSIYVSVISWKHQTREMNDTCRPFLTLHGEYGASLPAPIRLTHRPHCNVRTDDVLGSVKFAEIKQENQYDASCKWHPAAVSITNPCSKQHRVFRCVRSMSTDNVSKLRRRRSLFRGLEIRVRTAIAFFAGTGANVYMKIFGTRRSTGDIPIIGNFTMGDIVENTQYINEIGVIERIRVWHDSSGPLPGWKLDWVHIDELSEPGVTYTFNCGCWLKDNHTSIIIVNNTTSCPIIQNCDQQRCRRCVKCKAPPLGHLLTLTSDKKQCILTCSYVSNRWCWPGQCHGGLARKCTCDPGFKERPVDSCDIDTKADLITCRVGIEDNGGNVRNSISSGNITNCDSETDSYVDIQPQSLSFKLGASFQKKIQSPQPRYISSTQLGIVDARVTVLKQDIRGARHNLSTIPLNGGVDCSKVLSPDNPSTHLDCTRDNRVTPNLTNGERLCCSLEVFSGGIFDYKNASGFSLGSQSFSSLVNSKTICFRYDNVPPVHCSDYTRFPCSSTSPLLLSTRVTRSANITVSISGWVDPHPQHGKPDQASGVDFYQLEVYGMEHMDAKMLSVDLRHMSFKSDKLKGSDHNITVTLTDQPAMYVTMLEVHDVAGNVGYARRFLLYDNTSSLRLRHEKHLRVVSASKDTNYKWQTNHHIIRLQWTNRYYNNYYINDNLLLPIKADVENIIQGIYDQKSGVLPVSGTESVNGVTSFKYQWALNNASRTPWTPVPDFTNQSLSLDLNLTDGETYEMWIKAEDIMLNSIVDSVVVHIDTSVPVIDNVGVTTTYEKVIVTEPEALVSSNGLNTTDNVFIITDLQDGNSSATLRFQAYDIHSGIVSVNWTLRTSEKVSDVRSGSLKPSTLLSECVADFFNEEHNQSSASCYCPNVGPCEFFNYSLPLLNRPSCVDMVSNHTIHVTLNVINRAHLTSSLQLLVNVKDFDIGHYRGSNPSICEDVITTADFWSTRSIVGVATGSVGLVLLVSIGVLCYKRRKKGKRTDSGRETYSSAVAEGAVTTDHIYDGLKDVYESVGKRSSDTTPSENVYENVAVYTKKQDRATVFTASDHVYANTGAFPDH